MAERCVIFLEDVPGRSHAFPVVGRRTGLTELERQGGDVTSKVVAIGHGITAGELDLPVAGAPM